MKPQISPFALAAVLALAGAGSAHAQVYGSLANFDAVNDTGRVAHGFEIELEGIQRSDIYSVFGLDRNFGALGITTVERYGAPVIGDLLNASNAVIGVKVRYGGDSFANGAWAVGTPTGPYPFAGDSCWPGGNAQYASGVLSCDHFGVATYGTPVRTSYAWLVDPTGTGVLSAVQAAVPVVNFAYVAPPPGPVPDARPVVAEIEAHKADNELFGAAYLVKVFAKHLDHNVELDNLLKNKPDVPGAQDPVEMELEVFQAGDLGGNGKKVLNPVLGAKDAALVLRYEFFKYTGPVDALTGEALCGSQNHGGGGGGGHGGGGGGGGVACLGLDKYLGDFVGAQMAGFNAVQPPLPVPEPGSWALMTAGLASLGFLARRRPAGAAFRPR